METEPVPPPPAGEEPQRDRARSAGRRCRLVVLFCDLSGSTRLGRMLDAEHYANLLDEVRACARDIIERHAGRIVRIQGDGLLAVFGYPTAQDDDAKRATEAALGVHAAVGHLSLDFVAAQGETLAMHSGIHGGLVFVSEGDVERGRLDLLGDVPNVAAGLSAHAERGEILVSETTLGADVHLFDVSESRTLVWPGVDGHGIAVRLVRGRSVRHRFEARMLRGSAPFSGRGAELDSLRAALREVAEGRPQCLVVAGNPGLGKTRLLEEFLRPDSTSQFFVLRGYCESYLGAKPLQPFRQMIRTLIQLAPEHVRSEDEVASQDGEVGLAPGLYRDFLAPLAHLAGVGSAEAEEPARQSGQAMNLLVDLFDRLATDRPLLLVVDDWQWADDASRSVLDAVRALPRPIYVLLATRDVAGDDPIVIGGRTLALRPLEPELSVRMIARLLPGADPFTATEIHRYAGGIPLYIEEICHSMAAQARNRPLATVLTGPAWLGGLIEARMARLPAALAEIVKAAAVIGTVFPAWLLERVAGLTTGDERLETLAEEDFIFPAEQAGMLRFKHGITREAVYDTVGLRERRALHGRIAAILAVEMPASAMEGGNEALAYHCGAAGLYEEAVKYAELAGDSSMAVPALDRARTQYTAALAALRAQAPLTRDAKLRWCAIAQKLGMACVFDPLALPDGVAVFEEAFRLARETGDDLLIARAEYWLGYICYAKGMARKAARHCESALALATRAGDPRLAAQVRATLGQVLASAADYDRALPMLESALDAKRRQARPGSNVAVGSAYTLACMGSVLGDRGRFPEAEACFQEALALLGDSVHQVVSSVRNWAAAVYMWQGRWEDAIAMLEGSARVAEHVKSRQLLAMSRAQTGYCRWMLKRDPAGLQAVRDATDWIEARNGLFLTSLNYGWLVEGAVTQNDTRQARSYAARLFLRARADDRIGEAMGCRALAVLEARQGREARATWYLQRAQRAAEIRGAEHERVHNSACELRVRALLQARREPGTHEARDLAQAYARLGMTWFEARAREPRGD